MTYEQMGGDEAGRRIGEAVFADYSRAGVDPNSGMSIWFWRTSYDALTLGIEASVAKHRAEWRALLPTPPGGWETAPVPPSGELPPIPSREQVCSLRTSLQGLSYATVPYGVQPACFWWWKFPDYRESVFPAHRHVGDTHLTVMLSGSYKQPGTAWPSIITDGDDFSQRLWDLKAILRETIVEGFILDLALAGDGESNPNGGYNDPVGSTYGYQWLMNNLERVIRALQGLPDSACPDGEDLTPYILFRPGWDGVFYGWDPVAPTVPADGMLPSSRPKLRAFGQLFRHLLPNGYLAIEHTPGNIPGGQGSSDWEPGGCMEFYDTLLSEYDAPLVHNDKVWQIAARTLGPSYRRPPDQPAGSDHPNPPWYLHSGSPRGPYYVVAFEYDTYHWCRNRISLAQVQADRAYLTSVGYSLVG